MKAKVYNLIILDESGSMTCVCPQTISGCNETINTIRAAQEKFADTQEHLVSIYAFQGSGNRPSRYLIKNVPGHAVQHITENDYCPCGSTPLYDALGATLNDLKLATANEPTSVSNVTIITDGYENASREYTHAAVARLIDELKELGWSFNFIGANIDVERVATGLNIDNSMTFCQDAKGTQQMFERERKSRMRWFRRTSDVMDSSDASLDYATQEACMEYRSRMKDTASMYFNEEDEDKK